MNIYIQYIYIKKKKNLLFYPNNVVYSVRLLSSLYLFHQFYFTNYNNYKKKIDIF